MSEHLEKLIEWLRKSWEQDFPESILSSVALTVIAEAQVALAEQARIANLIALAESGRTTLNGASAALSALYTGSSEDGSANMALRTDIARALKIYGAE